MSESLENEYDVLEKIGHGSFGVIRKVRRKADGMVLCRKEISYLKMSQKERDQLHAEFQILSTLRHPNIVGYYHREHLKESRDLHLYMEYCGNGDLGRIIKDLHRRNRYAEESFVWSIFSQLVTALYRCHYGVDPPAIGMGQLGLGAAAKPKAPTGGMTILHRDLKPENVFLGEDNSVKLGDFGLSKMIESHDFASTYVGTPFYMSPEICAAEKYTLKSDIWSLGCIMYELCSRVPPFNAKTHFQLVQKIKEGRFNQLPPIYSSELNAVIKDCLRVNPDRRPDTAALLNLPVVRLMRKEKEVTDYHKELKKREDAINRRLRELDAKLARQDSDRVAARCEMDASLRREWEVKARLEIDRLVKLEIERLKQKFDEEVRARVEKELMAHHQRQQQQQNKTTDFAVAAFQQRNMDFSSSTTKSDYHYSSIGASSVADGDFPSQLTDLTELSVHEDRPSKPEAASACVAVSPQNPSAALKKTARTPFARAQTMFVNNLGTPMDVEMASPSPTTIASLSLSPRRNAAMKAPAASTNIFAAHREPSTALDSDLDSFSPVDSDDNDDEEHIPVPSPTRNIRQRSKKNPFDAKSRPMLHAQASAPVVQQTHQLRSKVGCLNQNTSAPAVPRTSSNPDFTRNLPSPSRRLSKIPSVANLPETTPTLSRKPSIISKEKDRNGSSAVKGRTLVELQQAQAGGRPLSALSLENALNMSPKRVIREHQPPAVWDPARDEMPSPFLTRGKGLVGRA